MDVLCEESMRCARDGAHPDLPMLAARALARTLLAQTIGEPGAGRDLPPGPGSDAT